MTPGTYVDPVTYFPFLFSSISRETETNVSDVQKSGETTTRSLLLKTGPRKHLPRKLETHSSFGQKTKFRFGTPDVSGFRRF